MKGKVPEDPKSPDCAVDLRTEELEYGHFPSHFSSLIGMPQAGVQALPPCSCERQVLSSFFRILIPLQYTHVDHRSRCVT